MITGDPEHHGPWLAKHRWWRYIRAMLIKESHMGRFHTASIGDDLAVFGS